MMPPFNFTIYKVSTTRNAYGDYTAGAETAYPCHFRDITNISTTSASETLDADAICWLEPDADVDKGDILKFEGVHYRVERITKARTLRSSQVQFLKCELNIYGDIS